MQTMLVDSNIFLDYYLDKKDNLLPLGEFAFRFIKRAVECKYFIIVCFETVEEISLALGKSEEDVLKMVFNGLIKKRKIEIVHPSPEFKRKALKISAELKIPFNDALFAVVAEERNVPIVTRDNHFSEVNVDVEVVKPEELD